MQLQARDSDIEMLQKQLAEAKAANQELQEATEHAQQLSRTAQEEVRAILGYQSTK